MSRLTANLVLSITALAMLSLATIAERSLARLCASPPQQGAGEKGASPQRQIATAVRQLGNDSFKVRERAQRELLRIGGPALKQLREAVKSTDPEVVWRATTIIAKLNDQLIQETMRRLEGRWEVIAVIEDGKKKPLPKDRQGHPVTFAIKQRKLIVVRNGREAEVFATISLDPMSNPKAINLVYQSTHLAGYSSRGLFEISGQRLKWRFGEPEGGRPTSFIWSPGNDQIIELFRRVKK